MAGDVTDEAGVANDAFNREPECGAPMGVFTAPQPGAAKGRRARERGTDRPPTLQLETRALEVVKLAKTHGLFYRCVLEGWDEDDLVQELLLRVHERQQEGKKSKYDPTKSAWGTYVFLITKTILMNLIEVQRTKNRREDITDPSVISGWGDGDRLPSCFEVAEEERPIRSRVIRGVPRWARKLVEG